MVNELKNTNGSFAAHLRCHLCLRTSGAICVFQLGVRNSAKPAQILLPFMQPIPTHSPSEPYCIDGQVGGVRALLFPLHNPSRVRALLLKPALHGIRPRTADAVTFSHSTGRFLCMYAVPQS